MHLLTIIYTAHVLHSFTLASSTKLHPNNQLNPRRHAQYVTKHPAGSWLSAEETKALGLGNECVASAECGDVSCHPVISLELPGRRYFRGRDALLPGGLLQAGSNRGARDLYSCWKWKVLQIAKDCPLTKNCQLHTNRHRQQRRACTGDR